MNREILFRGKRTDNGEWTQGYLFRIWEKAYICWGTVNDIPDMKEVDPETVCQYTGLIDKNGRKIFEGDVVKALYKPKDEDLTTDYFIIKWDKYCCKYVGYYTRKENEYNPLLFGSQVSFEIIGNIFGNPELMEGA